MTIIILGDNTILSNPRYVLFILHKDVNTFILWHGFDHFIWQYFHLWYADDYYSYDNQVIVNIEEYIHDYHWLLETDVLIFFCVKSTERACIMGSDPGD